MFPTRAIRTSLGKGDLFRQPPSIPQVPEKACHRFALPDRPAGYGPQNQPHAFDAGGEERRAAGFLLETPLGPF